MPTSYDPSAPTPLVILLHGFPYDVRAYDEVAERLAAAGADVVELGPISASIHKVDEHVKMDDVGALTWDTMLIVQKAIQDCGEITGDLATDRACVRDALGQIKDFEGITGTMTFTEEGDPNKCAVIVKISDKGEYEFYKSICP